MTWSLSWAFLIWVLYFFQKVLPAHRTGLGRVGWSQIIHYLPVFLMKLYKFITLPVILVEQVQIKSVVSFRKRGYQIFIKKSI